MCSSGSAFCHSALCSTDISFNNRHHLTCYFKGCTVHRMCAGGSGKPCFVSNLEKLLYKSIPQGRQCFCWLNCPLSPLNHVCKSSSQKISSLAPVVSLLYLAHTFVNMALDYLSC